MTKKQRILDVAKQRFLEQGIRGTTIADIATHAGIAKGSVYSYFASKAEIVQALFQADIDKAQTEIEALLASDSAVEGLLQQHIVQSLTQVVEERAFQQMWMSDDSQNINAEVLDLVNQHRAAYFDAQRQLLLKIYGDAVTPWLGDVITVLNGMLQEYSVYITLDNASFSLEHCSQLIDFVVTQTVKGLTTNEHQLSPVLGQAPVIEDNQKHKRQLRLSQLLDEMSALVADLPVAQQSDASESLELIKAELEQEQPKSTMLRALIANLRPYQALHRSRAELADLVDVELI